MLLEKILAVNMIMFYSIVYFWSEFTYMLEEPVKFFEFRLKPKLYNLYFWVSTLAFIVFPLWVIIGN